MPRPSLPLLFLISLTLLLVSCQSLPPIPAAVQQCGDTIPWRRDQVEGLHAKYQGADGSYELLTFHPNGVLGISAGSTAPGGFGLGVPVGWRLTRGRLFKCSIEERDDLGEEFHLVSLTTDQLTLRDADGDLLHYQVMH